MGFDSLAFLLFFAIVWLVARAQPMRGWVLLAASLSFYSFSGASDSLLLAVVLAANYQLGRLVAGRSRILAAAVLLNLVVLVWFKYRSLLFEVATAGSFAGDVAIPLGISFYVFQLIAYQVDVHRGVVSPERSIVRFVLFVTFFPQLIAGPIVRANTLLPQARLLFAGRGRRVRTLGFGLVLCMLGILKKVVLADSLAPIVEQVFVIGPADAATAWLGAVLFAFQIYFDFSGYSDMAVGMAWLLGVRLPCNFRTPYLSCSPQDFWRRWHITLSMWIRDYLYIPLGGSRASTAVERIAVLAGVMGLAGLWHGANWTYLVWGLLWGLIIGVWRMPILSAISTAYPVVGWLLTMGIVLNLWVVFRSPTIGFAWNYCMLMWGARGPIGPISLFSATNPASLIIAGCASLLALHALERETYKPSFIWHVRCVDGPLFRGFLLAAIGWLLVMPKMTSSPFIYFRF